MNGSVPVSASHHSSTILDRADAATALQSGRLWQGLVILLTLLFVAPGLLMATSDTRPSAAALVIGAIDVVALLTLPGYACPLRHVGLQLLVFLLAAVQFFRLTLVAIVVWQIWFRGAAIRSHGRLWSSTARCRCCCCSRSACTATRPTAAIAFELLAAFCSAGLTMIQATECALQLRMPR